MFRNAKNTTVLGGTFTVTELHEGSNGRRILGQSPFVVHGAIHDSGQRYPPSECHPGTRKDVLKTVLRWVDKPLDERESQLFWLSGPAGVGKTAIAQSLCQRLKALSRLGGDFFLSRSVAGHSDLHTLFPTIAYQLARAYPEFGFELDSIIKADESIVTKNIRVQLEQLIVSPLKLVKNKLNISLVLIIDGLDEAGRERDQTSFLRLLGSCFLNHSLPLKIILTSRPEPWIKSAFGDNPLHDASRSHFLRRTLRTDHDIRTFLKSKFAKIRRTHDLMKSQSDRDTWPPSNIIDDIVDNASGQFIYASTILRYIEDPNGNPVYRLRWIMKASSAINDEFSDSPFLALDNLYRHVLSTSSNTHCTLLILGAVIGFITTPDLSMQPPPLSRDIHPLSFLGYSSHMRKTFFETKAIQLSETDFFPIDRIERIFNFRVGEGFLALRTIQSLVDIPFINDKRGIRFYHKSFQDFLLDPNRSRKYFIDMKQVYSKLVMGSFRLARDYVRSETISNRSEIRRDLEIVQRRWRKWWLCSAASDQDLLLTEIKNIDRAALDQDFAGNIKQHSQKKNLFISNKIDARGIDLLKSYRSNDNIAESISWEIDQRITFAHSLEIFTTVETLFDQYLTATQQNCFHMQATQSEDAITPPKPNQNHCLAQWPPSSICVRCLFKIIFLFYISIIYAISMSMKHQNSWLKQVWRWNKAII